MKAPRKLSIHVGACVSAMGMAFSGSAWADRPVEPQVAIAPQPGKPPDLFAAEQDFCRSEAEANTAFDEGGDSVLRSAALGTVLGAAAGAVLSGRRHDNTGAGAVAGLVLGTVNGMNRQAAHEFNAQRRFDTIYEQCMLAKGNGAPAVVVRQVLPAVSAPPVYPAPGAGGAAPYPPPPPRPPADPR